MIYIGVEDRDKSHIIQEYVESNGIKKTIILSPKKLFFDHQSSAEVVEWDEIIMYRFFYRLLQEIGSDTLVVVNEILRTQKRTDLTYNCIRHYLNQTPHKIIFQRFPLIDTIEDFMILFDFETNSRWKHEKFDIDLLEEVDITVLSANISIKTIETIATPALVDKYQAKKKQLFEGLGNKDPHTIPRNLYLLSGKARLQLATDDRVYIARNRRFKRINRLATYRDEKFPDIPYTVFDLPHNFLDFIDFLSLSGQRNIEVFTSNLKVDRWYVKRYIDWTRRLDDAITSLSRG